MTKSSRPFWATGGPITIIKMYFVSFAHLYIGLFSCDQLCSCVFQMLAASQVRDLQVFLAFSATCSWGCSVGSSLILPFLGL